MDMCSGIEAYWCRGIGGCFVTENSLPYLISPNAATEHRDKILSTNGLCSVKLNSSNSVTNVTDFR